MRVRLPVLALLTAAVPALLGIDSPAVAEPPAPAAPVAPTRGEELAARHVLVTWAATDANSPQLTKEQAKTRADAARAALAKPGADFATVSHEYSDDRDADRRGGFLGIFSAHAMDADMTAAVRALKEGEVSAPIETKLGFHVVQRLSIADAVALIRAATACVLGTVFQYQGATLPGLPDASAQRTREQAKVAAEAAYERLKAGASLLELPKELGARSLRKQGWVYAPLERGMTPEIYRPALEDAAFATPVGGLSRPADTRVGWVILKRIPWFRAHVKQILVMHKDTPQEFVRLDSRAMPPYMQRLREQALQRATQVQQSLRADPSGWSKAVAAYSDEPGAAARDGEMRLAQPPTGNPRELDEALSTLAPGAVSDVVETRVGFHVLKRFD
jgi:parvulin-like peptidyl-prolyl isomerase